MYAENWEGWSALQKRRGRGRIGAETSQQHVENSTQQNSMQFSIYKGGIDCSTRQRIGETAEKV